MDSNRVEHTSSLGVLMPLEERIVLDAALMLDIGSMTFLDKSQSHDGVDSIYRDTLHLDHVATGFDHHSDPSDAHIMDHWSQDDFNEQLMHHEPIVINVDRDLSETAFDLSEIYPASDILAQMGLINFELIDNDNPDFVSAQIDDVYLNMQYTQDDIGEANLMIRGTYLDGKVYETPFKIQSVVTTFYNPWIPQEPQVYAFDEMSDASSDATVPGQSLDSLMVGGGMAVKEISGFFGQSSFEEGSWAAEESTKS